MTTLSRLKKSLGQLGATTFRGYLAEDYDGIGQYALVTLSRGSTSGALKARISAGDFNSGATFPRDTPVIVFSDHGQLEVLSLGSTQRTQIITENTSPDFEDTGGFLDLFERSESDWNTATSGQLWVDPGDISDAWGDAYTTGTTGVLKCSNTDTSHAGGDSRRAAGIFLNPDSINVLIAFRAEEQIPSADSDDQYDLDVRLEATDGADAPGFQLSMSYHYVNGPTNRWFLDTEAGESFEGDVDSGLQGFDTDWLLRIIAGDGTLGVRMWAATDPEPGSFEVEVPWADGYDDGGAEWTLYVGFISNSQESTVAFSSIRID